MRPLFLSLTSCLWFLPLMAASPGAGAAEPRPNILFFLTDDESWPERSAYGWSTLPTPGFDRVAREGVLFTNAFTSAPSCAPSRASVLAGRNFWELKQGAFIQAWIPEEFPLFPALLARAGYCVGKTGKGWGPGIYPEGAHGKESAGKSYDSKKVKDPAPATSGIDYAANFDVFLDARDGKEPFFFWAGTTEPHGPWDKDNHKRLEKEFGVSPDQIQVPGMVEDTPEIRRKRADFLYEICCADRHLDRMLKSLDARGELENTLVVVTSDNGTAIAQGKASPYEWGVHEPLAVMWPAKVRPGRTVTDFVNFADFAPTFLEASGVGVPDSMSGKSLMPVLTSENSGRIDPARNYTVTGLEWHGEFDPVCHSSRTIRDDRYAYIVRYANVDAGGGVIADERSIRPAGVEFYDLKQDPWQRENLADDPALADEMRPLAEKLRRVQLETGDPRATGDMENFRRTRQFVQARKKAGYPDTAGSIGLWK